ncbi:MAG: polysaccharide deacetylase [Acidobacteriota bacterium]
MLLALCLASLAGGGAGPTAAEGRRARPWPEGTVAAVTLGIDFDAETLWWDVPETQEGRPGPLSQGRYGPRQGLKKILSLLRKHEVRATFFVPSWVARKHPDAVRAIVEGGHEIGAHGVLHVPPSSLDPGEEERRLRDSIEVLKRIAGRRPVGYRAPAWSISGSTLDLVAREEFLYSSNLMDSDLPYVHAEHAGLVELPVSWVLDDAAHFWFEEESWDKPIVSAAAVESIWKEQFEAIYEEGAYFNLTLHPQFIGRPAPRRMLDRFLTWIRSFEGVWFATGEELARRVRESAR